MRWIRDALALVLAVAASVFGQTVTVLDTRPREYPFPLGKVLHRAVADSKALVQRSPLRVTVLVRDPSKITFGKPFEFEVLVKNTSTKNVSFPAAPWDQIASKATKDSSCVMTGVTLSVFGDTRQAEKKLTAIYLLGSPDVPGTTVLIKPGDTLRILGRASKIEEWDPFIKGHVYATLGIMSAWWTLPDGDRCKHQGKPFGIVESAPGPVLDLRRLPPSQ